MNPTEDTDTFDELQIALLTNLLKSIKSTLEEAGIEDERIEDLVGSIGFSTSCIFDASTVMSHKGKPLTPLLTFAQDEVGDDVVYSKNGSWMHEYVFGCVDEIFDEGSDEEHESVCEMSNDDYFNAIILFRSGIRLSLGYWSFDSPSNFTNELCREMVALVEGHKRNPSSRMKERVVGELCEAFSSIEKIEIKCGDKLIKELTGEKFECLSIKELGAKILDAFPIEKKS